MKLVPRDLLAERQSTVAGTELTKPYPTRPFVLSSVSFEPHRLYFKTFDNFLHETASISNTRTSNRPSKNFSYKKSPKSQRKLHASVQDITISENIKTLFGVATVHYKPSKFSVTQMEQHCTVCNEYNDRVTQNWCNQVSFSEKYKVYRKRFQNMSSKMRFLSDVRIGTITKAKRRVVPPDPATLPMHSASYHAVPKDRESEETKITKMLEDSSIDTEQAY